MRAAARSGSSQTQLSRAGCGSCGRLLGRDSRRSIRRRRPDRAVRARADAAAAASAATATQVEGSESRASSMCAGCASAGLRAAGGGLDDSITKLRALWCSDSSIGLRQGHAGEFGQIALVEKFRQQVAMRGERCVRGFEQIAQKLLGGAMRGRDPELHFDVLAHDVRHGDGEFARARGLQERADVFETLQRDLERQQRPRRAPAPLPAPQGV